MASNRITFITEEWGANKEAHLEVQCAGGRVMITITDDAIKIIGTCLSVERMAVNSLVISPVPCDEYLRRKEHGK